MLFSATITPKTEDLIRLALKKSPAHVGIDDTLPTATVEGLEQVRVRLTSALLSRVLCALLCHQHLQLHLRS